MKINELTKELSQTKKEVINLESDKKRLEDHLNKAGQQVSFTFYEIQDIHLYQYNLKVEI